MEYIGVDCLRCSYAAKFIKEKQLKDKILIKLTEKICPSCKINLAEAV